MGKKGVKTAIYPQTYVLFHDIKKLSTKRSVYTRKDNCINGVVNVYAERLAYVLKAHVDF